MSFGENLKKIRKEKNITLKELAEKLEVTSPNISQYEHDKRNPSLKMILKFAAALNCSIEELIPDTSLEEYGLYKEFNYIYGGNIIKEYEKSIGVNDDEMKLLKLYRNLNDKGKSKAIEYIKDIMSNPTYSDSNKDIPTI